MQAPHRKPVVPDADSSEHSLTPREVERYSRQLILPQFGPVCQLRLKRSRILIIGVGGLGSPAALYLAGAGVGTLGLVDRPGDVVDRSNLHRQIAHADVRVGVGKPASAATAISALNPLVQIVVHDDGISSSNAVNLVSSYDVVLDCTDNVPARYLVGDACGTARVPLVSAAAVGLEGQITVLCADEDAPCYRCLYPMPPPPACVGSCDAAGVLGPVPGVIGTLQALEALKLAGSISGTNALNRRMLLFDGAESNFRNIKLRGRKKDCAVCGEQASVVVGEFDYDKFALGGTSLQASSAPEVAADLRMSVQEFAKRRDNGQGAYRLVDVRPAREFDMCHLEEADNIPLNKISSQEVIDELKKGSVPTVLICRRGNASRRALQVLVDAGVHDIRDVQGGLQEWHFKIDPDFPLY